MRTPVLGYELAGGVFVVVCDDGSMWACAANGDQQRVWTEGTPVPGTARAQERSDFEEVRAAHQRLAATDS